MLSYSVVIRTLGNTGEKYRRLINAINSQTVKPDSIIVVLPYGYSLDYISGSETIIHSQKGMVSQRAIGIMACYSEYMLVVDDDIEFGSEMVEELYNYLVTNQLDCCLPLEGIPSSNNQLSFSVPFFARVRNAFTGQVFTSKHDDTFLDKITYTAGHKVFTGLWNPDVCYPLQTGNFQCFFIKSSVCKSVHLEDELWLQQGTLTQYSAYDDSTFFYKLYLLGGKISYALKVRYIHLDAAVGRPTKSLLESRIVRYYSISRNRTIFWYKFIWQPNKHSFKTLPISVAGIYGAVNYFIWNLAISIIPQYWPAISAMAKGYNDAISFLKSNR